MNHVALVGATVIDVVNGDHVTNACVVVDHDVIRTVGVADEVGLSADTEVIDVTGKWLTPGLTDLHAHLTLHRHVPLELFLANGVCTVRDPGGHADEQRLLRESIERGDRIGPRVLASGNVLDGNPPIWPGQCLMVDTPARAEAAVRHLAAQGMDCVKIYNHVPEESLAVVSAVAAELGLPVIGHVPRTMSMRRAVELGIGCLEHIRITGRDFLAPERAAELDLLPGAEREPRLWELIDLDAAWVTDLIALLVDKGTYLDPTLIVDDVVFLDGLDVQRRHPDNQYLCSASQQEWAGKPDPAAMTMPERLRSLARDCVTKRHEFVGRCAEAGVPILTGTDGADLGKLLPGFAVHREISLLRGLGMPALDVLRGSTITAAEALGRDPELGSIEEGKIADIVVATSDPLTATLRPDDIEYVFHRGERFRPTELLASLTAPAN